MKNHNLHVTTAFKEKSSDHFKDIFKLKVQTNFDVNMTSFQGGVPDYVLNL